MITYVTRRGQNIAATVLYNFQQACNVVILKLHPSFFTEGDCFVLMYDQEDRKWTEIDHLDQREPLFFQQILSRLANVLTEAEKYISQSHKADHLAAAG